MRGWKRARYEAALAGAMDSYPCRIVISFAWRHHLDISGLCRRLPPTLTRRVVDVTGPEHAEDDGRYRDIMKWLETHGPAPWRALDDASKSKLSSGGSRRSHADSGDEGCSRETAAAQPPRIT